MHWVNYSRQSRLPPDEGSLCECRRFSVSKNWSEIGFDTGFGEKSNIKVLLLLDLHSLEVKVEKLT